MRIESPSRSTSRTLRADPRARALLSDAELRAAAQRERQRSDRCRSEVSLIRLELQGGKQGGDATLGWALERILRRVRAIDEVGWLAPRVVGILLPETNGDGAWKLVGDLLDGDATGLLTTGRIGVYCYPDPSPEDSRPVREALRGAAEPREPTHVGGAA